MIFLNSNDHPEKHDQRSLHKTNHINEGQTFVQTPMQAVIKEIVVPK